MTMEDLKDMEAPPLLAASASDRQAHNKVLVVTTDEGVPKDFYDAKVIGSWRIKLWNKDVDSDRFHPRFCRQEMRVKLTEDELEKPLVIHVGRIEKKLDFLKRVMDMLPGVRIAFVGDGPYRPRKQLQYCLHSDVMQWDAHVLAGIYVPHHRCSY